MNSFMLIVLIKYEATANMTVELIESIPLNREGQMQEEVEMYCTDMKVKLLAL